VGDASCCNVVGSSDSWALCGTVALVGGGLACAVGAPPRSCWCLLGAGGALGIAVVRGPPVEIAEYDAR